jgi:hypothetical protein
MTPLQSRGTKYRNSLTERSLNPLPSILITNFLPTIGSGSILVCAVSDQAVGSRMDGKDGGSHAADDNAVIETPMQSRYCGADPSLWRSPSMRGALCCARR